MSELLPESGSAQPAPAAAGKGAKGAAGKPAAPLVPQGKAKAEALIAAGATIATQPWTLTLALGQQRWSASIEYVTHVPGRATQGCRACFRHPRSCQHPGKS